MEDKILTHPPQIVESSFLKPDTILSGPVRGRPWSVPLPQRRTVMKCCTLGIHGNVLSSPGKRLWLYKEALYTYAVFVKNLIFPASSILLDRWSPAEFLSLCLSLHGQMENYPRGHFSEFHFHVSLFSIIAHPQIENELHFSLQTEVGVINAGFRSYVYL